MIEITLERPATRGSKAVLSLRHAPFERFRARDVFGLLELARVDAEVAVGSIHQLFEIAETERIVDSQCAHDAKAETLVNEPVERVRAGGRRRRAGGFTPHCSQIAHVRPAVIARCSVLSHRASG